MYKLLTIASCFFMSMSLFFSYGGSEEIGREIENTPSYPESQSVKKLRFFNLDLQISVIADVKYIFEKLGHEVVNWSISGHTWVFGKERDIVDVVNENTWGRLDQEMCDDLRKVQRLFKSI